MKKYNFYRTPKLSFEGLEFKNIGKIEIRIPPLNETFGNKRAYVIDKYQKAALKDLTGTEALMPMHLNALRILGFELVEVK
jgi:hypothetical protein